MLRALMSGMTLLFLLASCTSLDSRSPLLEGEYRLSKWKRGVRIRPLFQNGREMYLWFHEWNLFGAIEPGEFTHAARLRAIRIREGGRRAELESGDGALALLVSTDSGGANLVLTVTNRSGRDWPELAAIVPCLSPGPAAGSRKILRRPRADAFINEQSYCRTAEGWDRLRGREIRFHESMLDELKTRSPDLSFAFSDRWPRADTPVVSGLLIRESNDGAWVAGMEWERTLGVQAHNEWDCLHAAIRVGPLPAGESRVIRGRIILSAGTKEEIRHSLPFGTGQ